MHKVEPLLSSTTQKIDPKTMAVVEKFPVLSPITTLSQCISETSLILCCDSPLSLKIALLNVILYITQTISRNTPY